MQITKQALAMLISPEGMISMSIDVSNADGNQLQSSSFFTATDCLEHTMTSQELSKLGYSVSFKKKVTVPFLRVGNYDFVNQTVNIGKTNTIGVSVVRWLDMTISNSTSTVEVDLIERLKGIVQKGINPNIRLAFNSRVKASNRNGSPNWFMWDEIDARFPNSWVLLWGNSDEQEPGGEVLWHSETEIPETMQDNTFLYCNKSIAKDKPFSLAYDGAVRSRAYSPVDPTFSGHIQRLESTLISPSINRFYYDVVSKQGKLFTKNKHVIEKGSVSAGIVLSQKQIDDLFNEML